MTQKKCPIAWTKEDGPCPCAFEDNGDCNFGHSTCIPLHMDKYIHAFASTTSSCPQCGKITSTTFGDFARGRMPLCADCLEEIFEQEALATHIRGEL